MSEFQSEYDVVVVGGGPAGVCAAVQAGRAGARTLLVEKTGRLGGTTINGGINVPGLFHAWGRQIIAGIGWEIVRRTVEECGQALPDFTENTRNCFKQQVRVDMMVYAALSDEAVLASGADLLFHAMPAAARATGDGAWSVSICGKEGLRSLHARALIDCTGDANVIALTGLPLSIPDGCQPATLSCHASGYDLEKLDFDALDRAFAQASADGKVLASDGCWRTDKPEIRRWLRNHGENAMHTPAAADARSSAGRSRLEVESRRALLRLYRFLRTQPGLENLRIDSMSPECGVRETVTAIGRATVTVEDYSSGRVWEEALCNSFYPIDLHGLDSAQWQAWPLKEGTVATVPRGALLPAGSVNLAVAGRCVSSDRLANSALRIQASCMAMGQAAGAMAALAVQSGVAMHDLALDAIRDLLRKHGAIVPEPV